MSLPIIQALWIGEKLSAMEALCVASFLHHGHTFHLYAYNELENVPAGAKMCDANKIVPRNAIFTHGANNSYAPFADWFRWELLWQKGGFWVDMDVICLKPFEFQGLPIFAWEGELVSNAVMGLEASTELSDFMRTNCKFPNRSLPYDSSKAKRRKLWRRLTNNTRSNVKWGEAGGPLALTQALKHFDLLSHAKPFTHFYPIHFSCWQAIFDTTLKNDINLFNDSYAIHCWNEMTRKDSGFNKDGAFVSDSLFMQLYHRFLPPTSSK